jgi:hypothetical protein
MLDAGLHYAFDYDLWMRAGKTCRFGRVPDYLACSRMHQDNLTLGSRRETLRECMRVLRRHYGYVTFRWVHTYVSYLLDRRDQFFEPLRPSLLKYLGSLPAGLWQNPAAPLRYWREWRGVVTAKSCLAPHNEGPAGPSPG